MHTGLPSTDTSAPSVHVLGDVPLMRLPLPPVQSTLPPALTYLCTRVFTYLMRDIKLSNGHSHFALEISSHLPFYTTSTFVPPATIISVDHR
jgi:hypothetical protein